MAEKQQELVQVTLTPAMATSLIPILENEIGEIAAKQTQAKGALHRAEKEYLKAKKLFQELNELFKQKKEALESILQKVGQKEIKRILRATSHTTTKPDKRISWAKEFVVILKAEQRFMTMDELQKAYLKKFPATDLEKFKIAMYSFKYVIKESDKNIKQKLAEGKQLYGNEAGLIAYADHWGLVGWFEQYSDGKLLPKANYMKQFMYNKAV